MELVVLRLEVTLRRLAVHVSVLEHIGFEILLPLVALRQPEKGVFPEGDLRGGQALGADRSLRRIEFDVDALFFPRRNARQRAGLPVEITAEFETWRRIRDSDGAEGWVYHSLLSGRRTGVVTAKAKDDLVPVYDSADAKGRVIAQLERGVQGSVKRCNAGWCKISGQGYDGWIQQDRLWGVYPDESF